MQAKPDLAVLFVGNSYSFGVPKAFSKIAASHGKKVRTGHATYGGWTLEQHAENEATLRKIRDGRWDIVVIQEQSEIPALPARKARGSHVSPAAGARSARPRNKARFRFSIRHGAAGTVTGRLHGDDFHAMTRRLREGYHAAAGKRGRTRGGAGG